MNKKFFKNAQWSILIYTLILFSIGLVALYSCTQATEFAEMKKQVMFFLVSIPIIIVFVVLDYNLISKISPVFYGIFMLLLIIVLFTPAINGASSWFNLGSFSFQPAEFAKVFVIAFLAYVISKFQEKGKKEINKPWKLLVSLVVVLAPVLLIAIQPDIGTAAAYIIATIFILFIAGIDKKYIIVSLLLLVILIPVVYMFILPDHAKSRIDVFLDPTLEPRGAGYNIIQSKLAIGAGKLFGMGILKGNQTQLGFLYPKTTDFIFAVIGEEMGFVISAFVVILYVLLITKAIYVAKTAKDDIGSYMAAGIARNFILSRSRKYWYDYRTIADNWCSIAIYQLWR